MEQKSILGAMSYYVGSCYTSEEGEFDMRSCVNGCFPIIATRTYAISLLSSTHSFYESLLDDSFATLSEEEKLDVAKIENELGNALGELSSSNSTYVVIGGKNIAYGSLSAVECYFLIGELKNVEFTNAVREWIEKYHFVLGDRLAPITNALHQIDVEFDELVKKVQSQISDFYEPYSESDRIGEYKFYTFTKVSDAINKLHSSLNYYKSNEVKEAIGEDRLDELQEIIDTLTNEIALLGKITSRYCVIRDGFDTLAFGEVEVAELIEVFKDCSLLNFSDFVEHFHGECSCAPVLSRLIESFVDRGISRIVADHLIR